MLVISRKAGEKLKIGDSVLLSVIAVAGDKVTIGIDAPREIAVLRGELAETIESNRQAQAQKPDAEAMLGLAALIKGEGER